MIDYNHFQIQEIDVKAFYARVNIKWTELYRGTEHEAEHREKLQRETTYGKNTKLFHMIEALSKWIDPEDDTIKVKKVKLVDHIDSFETIQIWYLHDRGSVDPDEVKSPKMEVSRLNSMSTEVEMYGKSYTLETLLEAIKMNLYQFLIKGTHFPPNTTTTIVDEDSGEVIFEG